MVVTATTAGSASGGSTGGRQVHELDLAEVIVHPANPRGPVGAGDEGMAELAESIRAFGVLEPHPRPIGP